MEIYHVNSNTEPPWRAALFLHRGSFISSQFFTWLKAGRVAEQWMRSATRWFRPVTIQCFNLLTPNRYLSGNFAPVQSSRPLTPCTFEGKIPADLAGGEYVRNGANPLANGDLGRDAHWFDGDGMLFGVLFRRVGEKGTKIEPQFVNKYLLTDVYCYAKHNPFLKRPVLLSIATLVKPAKGILSVFWSVFRPLILAIASRLPGRPAIRKISVANTNVIYHDGRALATCGSGPPLRFLLPGLETVGWFNGRRAQNERGGDRRSGFGGGGPLAFMKEWTTAHPHVDPVSKELITFHSTASKPDVRYSIVKPSQQIEPGSSTFGEAVPGITKPKMMHDFGVSAQHTVIMDLPLLLSPRNQLSGVPALHYDPRSRSRFGVFPRYAPYEVQWFETNPCLILHTANCWDTMSPATKDRTAEEVVNLLACRLTSAAAIFNPANVPAPESKPVPPEHAEEEQCRLYYYSFPLSRQPTHIRHQWALSAIPFEFPTVPADKTMTESQYVYGCSTSQSFTPALGKATKIDHLAKIDVKTLISRGIENPPQAIKGCVDTRTLHQVSGSKDRSDPIKLFKLPPGWYAQEPRFVARAQPKSEDDGWLLTYVFNESQLDEQGQCREDAQSELWIIDAKTMKDVVAKVRLPQRVPYGLHGSWFSEEEILSQKPHESVRDVSTVVTAKRGGIAEGVRDVVERWIG